jgi:putative flippase GtrA
MSKRRQMLGFVIVGSIGFLIDAGVLTALTAGLGWGPFVARFVSFPVAVLGTWALNRSFVFASTATSRGQIAREYSRYLGVQSVGAATNMVVYSLALLALPGLERWPVIALALGSLAGLFVNFAGARLWVFSSRPER